MKILYRFCIQHIKDDIHIPYFHIIQNRKNYCNILKNLKESDINLEKFKYFRRYTYYYDYYFDQERFVYEYDFILFDHMEHSNLPVVKMLLERELYKCNSHNKCNPRTSPFAYDILDVFIYRSPSIEMLRFICDMGDSPKMILKYPDHPKVNISYLWRRLYEWIINNTSITDITAYIYLIGSYKRAGRVVSLDTKGLVQFEKILTLSDFELLCTYVSKNVLDYYNHIKRKIFIKNSVS